MPNLKRLVNNWDYFYFKDAPIHISGVSLDKSSISLSTAWATEQLTATVTPDDCVEDKWVTWSSSDTSVATVSSTWLVTCVTPWECTITVTTNVGWFTATCSVKSFVPVDTCFWYTWAEQSILLHPATYKLEVWWAEWGSYWWTVSGKWWYSAWVLTLNRDTCLYIYVWWIWCSWTGNSAQNPWWWNWGWAWYNYNTTYIWTWWGWWTDIRIWWNTLYHRRIVAWWWGWGWYISWCSAMCWWSWWGCCWLNWWAYSSWPWWTKWTQTAWGSNGCFCYMVAWTFWCWWYKTSWNGWYSWSWWGWGWYWWWAWSAVSAWWGWGSWYVYDSTTCSNAPSWYCHCTDYFLIYGVSNCNYCTAFPSPTWWNEQGHCWCWCVRIRSL